MTSESAGIGSDCCGGRRGREERAATTAIETSKEKANGDGDKESHEKDEDDDYNAWFETIERRRVRIGVSAMARVDERVH